MSAATSGVASLAGVLVATLSVSAHAQSYPSKAIRLVVTAAAGGGDDF